MEEKNPNGLLFQVMVYHPSSLELAVYSKKSNEDVLEELDCPVERMQAQEPPASSDVSFSYSRGDIPMFNFDDADRSSPWFLAIESILTSVSDC